MKRRIAYWAILGTVTIAAIWLFWTPLPRGFVGLSIAQALSRAGVDPDDNRACMDADVGTNTVNDKNEANVCGVLFHAYDCDIELWVSPEDSVPIQRHMEAFGEQRHKQVVKCVIYGPDYEARLSRLSESLRSLTKDIASLIE